MTQTQVAPIAKAKVQLPANYQEELAAEAAEIAKRVAAPSGDKIGVKGKVFTFPDGTQTPKLDIVIVDFVSANKYYEGAYDKDNIKPPSCYAIGTTIDDMMPSPKSTNIQNAGKGCKTCWANQWSSDPKGGKGKACKNERLLGILAPEMQAEGPLFILGVAPMGTTPFDTHVKSATTLAGAVMNVVTEITFDPGEDYPRLKFKTAAQNEDVGGAFSRRKEARARLLTEPDYGAAPAAEPAKKTGGKKVN